MNTIDITTTGTIANDRAVGITAGTTGAAGSATTVDSAATASNAPAPSSHRRLVLTWLAVYPTITLTQQYLGASLVHLALPLRTLVVTGIVVPIVVYVLMPRLAKADARIVRAWRSRTASRTAPHAVVSTAHVTRHAAAHRAA